MACCSHPDVPAGAAVICVVVELLVVVQDFEADDYTPQRSAGQVPEAGSPYVSPWPALQLELGRAIYYSGFLLLPCTLFWVGLSQQDLSHGLYLALLLLQLLPRSLSLEPSLKAGTITKCQVCS